jgi:ABC-2 type transport system ATP-binding protein
MREILKELQTMGKTIVISSHILPELTELCTMVGIIDRGQMRATGPVQDVIRKLSAGRRLRICVLGKRDDTIAILKGLPSVREVDVNNGSVEADFEGDETTAAAILQALIAGGVQVSDFTQLEGGLEAAFLRATKEGIG